MASQDKVPISLIARICRARLSAGQPVSDKVVEGLTLAEHAYKTTQHLRPIKDTSEDKPPVVKQIACDYSDKRPTKERIDLYV